MTELHSNQSVVYRMAIAQHQGMIACYVWDGWYKFYEYLEKPQVTEQRDN